MKTLERRPGEGRVEHLARLAFLKNLGGFAIAASLAVVTGGAVAAVAGIFAAGEGVGAGVSHMVHQRLKDKRTGNAKH